MPSGERRAGPTEGPAYQHGRNDNLTALLLSAGGRFEAKAGRPAAGQTGLNLIAALWHLHRLLPELFPFVSTLDYTIVNAVSEIHYKALTKRTEGSLADIGKPANVARLRACLLGKRWVVTLGDKALHAAMVAGLPVVASGHHPGMQKLNLTYTHVDAETGPGRHAQRIKLYAEEIFKDYCRRRGGAP